MKKIRYLFLLTLLYISLFNLSAQNEVEGEIITIENDSINNENPVKQILATFLPDDIEGFTNVNNIRNDIDTSLNGCFKSYQFSKNTI